MVTQELREYKTAVVGGRNFNNYYIAYNFLDLLVPKNNVVISGGANGADYIAECYAKFNNFQFKKYSADWEKYGKNAGFIRNKTIVNNADRLIAFHDGRSHGTLNSIMLALTKRIPVYIVRYDNSDLISPSPNVVHCKKTEYEVYVGRGENSIWGNPFDMKNEDERELVVHQFTDYLIKNKELLNKVGELTDKTLGCWCAPKLCHGDMLTWLTTNKTRWIPAPKIRFRRYVETPQCPYTVEMYWSIQPEDIELYCKELQLTPPEYTKYNVI